MKALHTFLKHYLVKSFAKGELILCEGEVPQVAYVIKRGVVKTYNLTNDGLEKPISFDVVDELFPAGWVFGKLEKAQYFYEAFTDCEVYVIPRDEYIAHLKADPKLMYEHFIYLVGRYLNFQMRIYALEQSKANEKVLHTLHFLAVRFGSAIKKDIVRIHLPLTQQDLANFMGVTRETAGIELKKLERSKVIAYSHQNYIIHTDKLSQAMNEEYGFGNLLIANPDEY